MSECVIRTARPEDAEALAEAEPAVLEEPPPQAASRPAAPTTPAPLRQLRRLMVRFSKSMFINLSLPKF